MTKRILKPNTTQTPDLILDNLSAFTNPELRVALVVIRSTLGWGKESDWLTSSQLVQRSGMSRASVSPAIGSLVDRGILLVRDEEGNLLDTAAKRKAVGEAHKKMFYALNVEGPVKILDRSPVKELDRGCQESEQGPVKNLDTTRPTQDKTHSLQDSPSPRMNGDDLTRLTEHYATIREARPRGKAWLPIQQGFRQMVAVEEYSVDDVIGCMDRIVELGWTWTIKTVRTWIADFAAGKMPSKNGDDPKEQERLEQAHDPSIYDRGRIGGKR